MSALAAVTLRRQGAPGLLVTYAEVVAGLPIGPDGNGSGATRPRVCWRSARLREWMTRPTPARLADIHRTGAWTFLAWCFTEGYLRPDLDLLLAKLPGNLYQAWTALSMTNRPDRRGRGAVRLERGLDQGCVRRRPGPDLSDRGQDPRRAHRRGLRRLRTRPRRRAERRADSRTHNSARMFSLHQACYELRICQSRRGKPGRSRSALSSACNRSPSRVSARPRCDT